MARKTISIDERISRAKLAVGKAKDKYDVALAELDRLIEEKRKIQSKEILEAIDKSNKSYAEIMSFLRSN